MRIAAAALVLLAAYLGSWSLRRELGIIRPAANLAYFYYSDDERLDRALYVLYWPCYRLFSNLRHNQDRPPFVSPADQGP